MMDAKRIDIATLRRTMTDATLTGFRLSGGVDARKDAKPKISKMAGPKVSKLG